MNWSGCAHFSVLASVSEAIQGNEEKPGLLVAAPRNDGEMTVVRTRNVMRAQAKQVQ